MNDARPVDMETSKELAGLNDAGARVEMPIVPVDSIAGRALVAIIAIMTFLASLTIGPVVRWGKAAEGWQPAVARKITGKRRRSPNGGADADVATPAQRA